MKKQKCVVYARQSSGNDDVSDSVENQIQNGKRLAEEKNLDVVGVFSDLNTSGKTYPTGAEHIAENDDAFINWYEHQTKAKKYRAGLGAVVALLPEVDFIIVDDITRLYRPCTGSFLEPYINRLLEKENVKILQCKDTGVIDLNQFDSALITAIRNRINDEQIKNCKLKAKQAFSKMRNSGYFPNGTCKVFGTEYDRTTREITVKAEYIDLVKMVFDEIEKYTPYNHIIRALQERLTDDKIYTTTLYSIATNPIYCGYMRNKEGDLIECKQMKKPVITLQQFLNVQKVMQTKKKTPNKAKFRFLPFSGLLYCGECGARLVSGYEKGRTFYYCRDGVNIRKNKACSHSRVMTQTEEDLDGMKDLKRSITPFMIMSVIAELQEVRKRQNEKQDVEALRAKLANLKEKQVKINEMYLGGLMDAETLEKSLVNHKARMQELNAAIALSAYDEDEVNLHFRAVEMKHLAEKIMCGEIDDATYTQALKKTVKGIDCYEDRVELDTIFGFIRLDRMTGKRRLFPECEIKINGKLEKDFTFVIIIHSGKKEILLSTDKLVVRCE